jgi:hypothetical protein
MSQHFEALLGLYEDGLATPEQQDELASLLHGSREFRKIFHDRLRIEAALYDFHAVASAATQKTSERLRAPSSPLRMRPAGMARSFAMWTGLLAAGIILGFTWFFTQEQSAGNDDDKGKWADVVYVRSADGLDGAMVVRHGESQPVRAHVGQKLYAGDRIKFGSLAAGDAGPVYCVGLSLACGAQIDLAQNSEFSMDDAVVADFSGHLYADIVPAHSSVYKLRINAAAASVGITGTQFELIANGDKCRVRTEAGRVEFFNEKGLVAVNASEESSARTLSQPDQPRTFLADSLWRGRKPLLSQISVVGTPSAPIFAQVNFGPDDIVPPDDWVQDSGQEYDPLSGRGWEGPQLDYTVEDGGRGAQLLKGSEDWLRDSYVFAGAARKTETWKMTVPNGRYLITVCCGGTELAQGPHRVEIEGTCLIDSVITPAMEFIEIRDYPISVDDGQLTMTVGGSRVAAPNGPQDPSTDTTISYLIIKKSAD